MEKIKAYLVKDKTEGRYVKNGYYQDNPILALWANEKRAKKYVTDFGGKVIEVELIIKDK